MRAYIHASSTLGVEEQYNFVISDLFEGNNLLLVAQHIVALKRRISGIQDGVLAAAEDNPVELQGDVQEVADDPAEVQEVPENSAEQYDAADGEKEPEEEESGENVEQEDEGDEQEEDE